MKKTSFLKYFPSFLILTGVALWTNSLFFSPITNQNEAKLPHYWRVNLERSSAILDSVNHSMLINAELVSREYDRPIFDVMNQIAGFQQIAIKDLDKKLEQSDSNLYSIINQFNKSTAKSILHLAETNQLVRKENAQNILDDNQFYYKNSSDELDYSIAFQKNQLYKRVSTYSKYLYNKVGGGCNMCFERFEPNIDFEKPLVVGEKATAKVFSFYYPCSKSHKILNNKWRINNQNIEAVHRIAKLSDRFKDTSPKTFNVEHEVYMRKFKRFSATTDTIRLQKQFTIYPKK